MGLCILLCVRFCTLLKKTIAFGLQTNYLPQLNYLIYITVQFRVLGVHKEGSCVQHERSKTQSFVLVTKMFIYGATK